MKALNMLIRAWLIDSLIVLGLAGIAVFLLPWVDGWFCALSLYLGRKLFWLHSVVLVHFLPHVIIGCFLGFTAACIIRHRRLWVAVLPSTLLCVFYLLYQTFGPYPYPWSGGRYDFVIVVSWLILILASLVCARFGLRRRQSGTGQHALVP